MTIPLPRRSHIRCSEHARLCAWLQHAAAVPGHATKIFGGASRGTCGHAPERRQAAAAASPAAEIARSTAGERVARGGLGQRAGDADGQPAVHGEQAGVEGHIVGRARRQAVARSRRSLGVLSFHGLMYPANSIRRAMGSAGRSPQNTHWLPQLASIVGRTRPARPGRPPAGSARSPAATR